MGDKRILTIQDISCVGQCSLTVALPVISACGVETAVLPSAVLSTHTGGFTGNTFRDLSGDMPAVASHWKREGIRFDAVYTGYLGSAAAAGYARTIMDDTLVPGGLRIVDPAMADHGKLYRGLTREYAERMGGLCGIADIVLPNITEACMLTGTPFEEGPKDEAFVETLLDRVTALGARCVVLKGVSFRPDRLGVAVRADGKTAYYFHEKLGFNAHGTGDIFASAFAGCLMRGRSVRASAKLAADFTLACMKRTGDDPGHRYGVKFEQVLPMLAGEVNGAYRPDVGNASVRTSGKEPSGRWKCVCPDVGKALVRTTEMRLSGRRGNASVRPSGKARPSDRRESARPDGRRNVRPACAAKCPLTFRGEGFILAGAKRFMRRPGRTRPAGRLCGARTVF